MSPRRSILPLIVVVVVGLAFAACGDDGGDQIVAADDETTTTATDEAAAPLPDACAVVPDAAAVTGLQLAAGAPDGDDRRRVCAFGASEAGDIGVTVGLQGGSRFDEKAEQSEAATGPGEEIEGLGDRALYFFADDDIPEGVGGVLVEVGELTVDITMQGLDDAAMREAAVALAEHAVANL